MKKNINARTIALICAGYLIALGIARAFLGVFKHDHIGVVSGAIIVIVGGLIVIHAKR